MFTGFKVFATVVEGSVNVQFYSGSFENMDDFGDLDNFDNNGVLTMTLAEWEVFGGILNSHGDVVVLEVA